MKKKTKKDCELDISLILQNMTAILIIFVSLGIMIVIGNNKKNEKWILVNNKVSKGDEVYEIGDYYDYDESNNGKISNLTDVKWKVLGVNDEGNLLIVSASNVEDLTLGSKDNLENAKSDFIDGNIKLDTVARKYAQGKNASGGRSITTEDINKITKVDNNYELTYTYYWGKDDNPVTIDEETNEKYVSKLKHNKKFLWFDFETNKWNISEKTGKETDNNMTKITTSKNTLITYNYEIYDEVTGELVPFMEKDTKEYNMLFKDESKKTNSYWTKTKYANATNRFISYGYNVVKGADLNYTYLVYSSQNITENTFGVRAVIEIK